MGHVLDVKLPRERIKVSSFNMSALILLTAIPCLVFGGSALVFILFDWIFSIRAAIRAQIGGAEPGPFDLYVAPVLALLAAGYGAILLRMVIESRAASPVRIIAVEIDRVAQRWGKTWYDFRGSSRAKTAYSFPRSDEGWLFRFDEDGKPHFDRRAYSHSRFQKGHNLLYLDETRNIALAAEKLRSGGAALLDEALTHLQLNAQEKQQLLTNLRAQKTALAQDPERLERIIAAIPEAPLIFDWLSRWWEKLTKK